MSHVLTRSTLLRALLLGIAFFVLAEVSAPFVFAPFENAVVWLPSGLTLGVLVRSRRENWPAWLLAVAAAEIASVRLHGDPLHLAALWALANVLGPMVGASLLQRFLGTPLTLGRTREVAGLVAFGGIVGPLISAAVGALSIALFLGSQNLAHAWVLWFLSDATGVLLVAPLILTWRPECWRPPSPRRILEVLALGALLLLASDYLFSGDPRRVGTSMPFASFPLLFWAALRLGPFGAAAAASVLGTVAVLHTLRDEGAFAAIRVEPWAQVLTVEAYLVLLSISALTMAAVAVERARLESIQRLIADVGAILAEDLDIEKTMPRVARRIVPDMGRGFVMWMEDSEGALKTVANAGVPQEIEERLSVQAHHLPPDARTWVDPELHSVLAPLRGHGQVLGAIAIVSLRRNVVPRAQLPLVEALAHRCSLALENARLFEGTRRAIRERDEFIAIAAHELRTPLTALKLQLDRVLRVAPSTTAANSVTRQVSRLTRLVESLLDISRLNRGRIELSPEPTDLTALVRDVAERLGGEAARADSPLRLQLEADVRGMWDPLRLEQIVTNLVTNALKFGGGAPVEISVEQQGDRARLAVTDHGRGIEPGQVRRIFDRFAQAVSAREYGGLGLGLYLVKQLVESHGGHIDVSSEPGHGATFTVELPALPREQQEVPVPWQQNE